MGKERERERDCRVVCVSLEDAEEWRKGVKKCDKEPSRRFAKISLFPPLFPLIMSRTNDTIIHNRSSLLKPLSGNYSLQVLVAAVTFGVVGGELSIYSSLSGSFSMI
jgi:hypothetical protein